MIIRKQKIILMSREGEILEKRELVEAAFTAQKRSYSPYSHFGVGAALLCGDGRVFCGCNIENSAYGVSNCAERTALFTAVYEGCRDFKAIAVVGKKEEAESFDFCPPCGICRQALMEFCDPESFEIILAKDPDETVTYKLKDLMPVGFTPDYLG